MYYEEKIINGVLCCKYHPKDSWIAVNTEAKRALQESNQVIMDLVRGYTHGHMQGKMNPYAITEVRRALEYLAKQQGISDYLNAVVTSDLYSEE